MKRVEPTSKHLAFCEALETAIADHGATLDAQEVLAILSNLVGRLIAMQDQRTMTPAMAMEVVSSNIERGNLDVIERLLTETGGRA